MGRTQKAFLSLIPYPITLTCEVDKTLILCYIREREGIILSLFPFSLFQRISSNSFNIQ